jgi:hypothetical protein
MTERGAAPDNGAAVEPREAQRPTSLAARTPTAAIPGNGDIAVGVLADREVRPCRPRSLRVEGSLASSLAPPGAPSPPFSRGKENRETGFRAPEK